MKGTILAISGFLASICTAQGNNGGTSQPHDWDNLSEPITYVVHSKSYDLAPDGSTVLDDTTIDYLGPGQTGTTSIPWAHNFSNEDKSSFQEVHEQFRIKYHWVAQNKPAPDFVYVTVNATAFAKGEPATGTVVLDNALGSPTVFMGEHDGYQARGTLTFKVPVSNGYAEKTLNLSASAYGLKSPTTGLLTNYATASTTVTTEIKGVKIVSDRSQTFKKEHDSTLGIDFKVANDETSTTDARIDVLLQMAGMQQNYVTFHGVFASVLEGSWINPYHVWIDFYGRTFSDSLLDEFDTLGSRYTAPFSQDVLKDGLTGSMHLSVRNLDPNDDVTIDFPLTTHFHMPQENPTVGRVDQDQIHRDKEILHAGPAAMMGGSQIVKISETLTIWDFFGWLSASGIVIGDLAECPILVGLAAAVHYSIDQFIPKEIDDVGISYDPCWTQPESTWDGSSVRPAPQPNDLYKMNGGIMQFFNMDYIVADGYDEHGYTGMVSSKAENWHREHGYGNYFTKVTGGTNGGANLGGG